MATRSRRALRVFALILCVFMVSFSPSSSVSATSCAALLAWAQPYSGTSPTLDDIGRLDRAHRRALFSVLTPGVKAALWQDQLHRFSNRADLSTEQRALINEARKLATPAFFAHDAAQTKLFQAFWPRVEKAFTSREHMRAWSDVGSVVSIDKLAVTENSVCQCNNGTPNYDCGGGSCPSGGCTQTGGCGPLGNLTCNGKCSS